MSLYEQSGSAVTRCDVCGHEITHTWEVGDPPIFTPVHCGEFMLQTTHNDGKTPLSDPCPSNCCPTRVHHSVYREAALRGDAEREKWHAEHPPKAS